MTDTEILNWLEKNMADLSYSPTFWWVLTTKNFGDHGFPNIRAAVKTAAKAKPEYPTMKTDHLRDSELIHYASLSDDPEKRRLAQAADAGRHRWEQIESAAEALQERAGELEAALDELGALKFRKDGYRWPNHDYLQYLTRLSKAVNDGRVQLVEDCPACGGHGFPDAIHRCQDCDGRGVILHPADSD